jgi:hypothetical protein
MSLYIPFKGSRSGTALQALISCWAKPAPYSASYSCQKLGVASQYCLSVPSDKQSIPPSVFGAPAIGDSESSLVQVLPSYSKKIVMKEPEPVMFLNGSWSGSGRSSYGPYELQAVVEQRGRWLLLRHAIKSPDTHDVAYVSTQGFGFDGRKLTLDYFDTAGGFKFYGVRNKENSVFDWNSGELWKQSEYWQERDGSVRFKSQSREQDQQTKGVRDTQFRGHLDKASVGKKRIQEVCQCRPTRSFSGLAPAGKRLRPPFHHVPSKRRGP